MTALETIHVIMIFTNAASNMGLQNKFEICLHSMLTHTSRPIHLHLISDDQSYEAATSVLNSKIKPHLESKQFAMIQLEKHPISLMTSKIDHELGDELIQYFRYNKQSYYGDNLFFLSIIAYQLFPSLTKVIQLDSDLKFMTDIALLYKEFDEFRADSIIGIAREQQPVYRNVFSTYRSRNPRSTVGSPPPMGVSGFNSGVLLIDLQKMAQSTEYQSLLNLASIERLAHKYFFKGHLGDQDLYTLLSIDHPRLFHILSCGWNRQLCRWWQENGAYRDVFNLYHDCEDAVKIYHGNCNTPIP